MYVEDDNGNPLMESDRDVYAFFMGGDLAFVNLEDGRTVEIDMHGNFRVFNADTKVIQHGAFNG